MTGPILTSDIRTPNLCSFWRPAIKLQCKQRKFAWDHKIVRKFRWFRNIPYSEIFYSVDSSLGRVPVCNAGDPGSIPGGGALNVCVQGEVLGRNVIHYVPELDPSHHLQGHNICHYVPVTPPPPPTTAIFRTFKKSTAPYKVHNMGLRYIKYLRSLDLSLTCGCLLILVIQVYQKSCLTCIIGT